MLRPKPAPTLRTSSCANGVQRRCFRESTEIPLPVSATERWNIVLFEPTETGEDSSAQIATSIKPDFVYLSELPKRFITMRLHAPTSEVMVQLDLARIFRITETIC